jgi:hypothetical protein
MKWKSFEGVKPFIPDALTPPQTSHAQEMKCRYTPTVNAKYLSIQLDLNK